MSSPQSRLSRLLAHFYTSPIPAQNSETFERRHNIHQLSPTFFLPRAADIEPEAPAIYHVTSDSKVLRRTYSGFANRARAIGHYIKAQGWKKVGILCPNTPAFLEAIFGIAAAGAVNVAVNYRLKALDISYIFTHSGVEAILVDAAFAPLLSDFTSSYPHIPLIIDPDTHPSSPSPHPPKLSYRNPITLYSSALNTGLSLAPSSSPTDWSQLSPQCLSEESTLALSYTSGTTGRPKGVIYTHRSAYLASMANIVESSLNHPPSTSTTSYPRARYLWTLPMFHGMGWTFPWSVTAVRGTHYCLRTIDYPSIWRLLKEERITHFNAAPTVNTLLCADKNAERLSHPINVTVAASAPTARLLQRMEELNLRPVHVYGLTETYGPITKGYVLEGWEEKGKEERYKLMARQGQGFLTSLPVRVVKVRKDEGGDEIGGEEVVDVKKDGKEIGEIVCEGNICAKGYYRDDHATRKLFGGGVLHTGDLAVWHSDGAVQILDREKDIIISGGENISSLSLESILATHPDILEAAVVAVADEKWGERPKAFITVKEHKGLLGEDVVRWAKENSAISGFMVPREVEIVTELPKTSTGKIRKNVLREWARGAQREV